MREHRPSSSVPTLVDFTDPRDGIATRLAFRFDTPRETLVAHTPGEVRGVLDAVERAVKRGALAVGAIRYEAACAFDPRWPTHPADGPLAVFALHDPPAPGARLADAPEDPAHAPTLSFETTLDRPRFERAMQAIRAAFADGRTTEINLTTQLHAELAPRGDDTEFSAESVRAFFDALSRAQPGGYAALVPLGEETLLSVSPELFFDFHAGRPGSEGTILTRPMKGTAKRGASEEEDRANAEALRTSEKERRENLLALEQMGRELAAIAVPGSVASSRVCHVEPLQTVWQMTSDLTASTPPGTSLFDVFRALFPSASVTGAPRESTMALIRDVELEPRGFYCGALGVVMPEGEGSLRAVFNVPIRTVVLRASRASIGVGSGITPLSSDEGEWREWQHKRVFLDRASAPFSLLETMRLESGSLRQKDAHLARMAKSAAHVRFPFDEAHVREQLEALERAHPEGVFRARLLLDALGRTQLEAHAFTLRAPSDPPVVLALATRPFPQAHGEFVRHKTTRRAHYEAFAPTDPSVFDTILWNEEGEITECARGNVAMRLDGRWVTPPLSSGLLPGVERAALIREGTLAEAVVRVEDAPRVEAWAFLNSLRGFVPAALVPDERVRARG